MLNSGEPVGHWLFPPVKCDSLKSSLVSVNDQIHSMRGGYNSVLVCKRMVKRLSWYLHCHAVATGLNSSWLSMTLFYHWGARRLGWQPRRLEGVKGVPKHGRVFRGSSAGTTGALENQEGKAPLGTNTNPSTLAKIDSVQGWQQHEVPKVMVRRGEYSWTGIFCFRELESVIITPCMCMVL